MEKPETADKDDKGDKYDKSMQDQISGLTYIHTHTHLYVYIYIYRITLVVVHSICGDFRSGHLWPWLAEDLQHREELRIYFASLQR